MWCLSPITFEQYLSDRQFTILERKSQCRYANYPQPRLAIDAPYSIMLICRESAMNGILESIQRGPLSLYLRSVRGWKYLLTCRTPLMFDLCATLSRYL
jgi:hypothetical protein